MNIFRRDTICIVFGRKKRELHMNILFCETSQCPVVNINNCYLINQIAIDIDMHFQHDKYHMANGYPP